MGTSAFTAYESADAESEAGFPVLDETVVVTMDSQTGGVSAGADQLMELEIKNGFIIKILRNRVAYIDR